MEKKRGRPTSAKKKDSRIEARIRAEYKNKIIDICECFNVNQSFVLQEMIDYFYKATKNPETVKELAPILRGECPNCFLIQEHFRIINTQDQAMLSELEYISRIKGKPETTVIRELILACYSELTRLK